MSWFRMGWSPERPNMWIETGVFSQSDLWGKAGGGLESRSGSRSDWWLSLCSKNYGKASPGCSDSCAQPWKPTARGDNTMFSILPNIVALVFDITDFVQAPALYASNPLIHSLYSSTLSSGTWVFYGSPSDQRIKLWLLWDLVLAECLHWVYNLLFLPTPAISKSAL